MHVGLVWGIINVLSPVNLAYCLVGVFVGTLVGVLPGLGPAATVAILLPLTNYFPPIGGMVMMAGIIYGAMYGGSTTSILVNVPGESSSAATCLDGFPMTKQGRGGEALAIAAIGSFIAGTGGAILITFAAPALASFALSFGPPEYFGIVFFSLTVILSLSGANLLKGVSAGLIGMVIACIGLDPVSGQERLVFGSTTLLMGLNVVPVLMGLFGIGEVLTSIEEKIDAIYQGKLGHLIPRGKELRKGLFASIRGSILGVLTGVLPGMIPALTTFISYDIEKRLSKYPEKFGTGCIEGVAAPEAANNGTAMTGFIPLMAFGIPTAPIFAIVLAAFMMYGIKPGPLLFIQHARFVWTLLGSMYLGNVLLLILNLPLVGFWARISLVPYRFLCPLILGLCFVGTYSLRNSMFDVWTTIFFGIVGYVMRKANWPIAPLILGVILGPMFEMHFRASLQMSGGSPGIFFTSPIAAVFIALGFLSILIIIGRKLLNARKKMQKNLH